MERNEVHISASVSSFVDDLPEFLQKMGYKINGEFARKFKGEIVGFLHKIPNLPAHEIDPAFAYHFERYGDDLKYVFWKRGNTTWYFFFTQVGNKILVKHISNNWTEGQYIR